MKSITKMSESFFELTERNLSTFGWSKLLENRDFSLHRHFNFFLFLNQSDLLDDIKLSDPIHVVLHTAPKIHSPNFLSRVIS
jgi:hypothetical protein